MKRRISFVLLVLAIALSFKVQAQWSNNITDASSQKCVTVGAYGMADAASTCITTSFATNFLEGNYIDDKLKQEVINNLSKFNRAGATLNYGVYAVWKNDTIRDKVLNFFVAIKHKSYANAVFSTDLFNVAFNGNAAYAGKTAYLTPLNFNLLSYNQAEVGLVCTNFGGKAEMGIGVSFLAGQQMMTINSRSATLYTDPTGQFLQASSNTEMFETDTSGNRKFINGYGASLDLYFKAPYKIAGRKGNIYVSATDLGFMFWNKNSLYYHRDTTYYYDGITINNLTDIKNVGLNTFSKDTIQNRYFPLEKKSFFSNLPASLDLNTNIDFGKYHVEAGFNYIFNAADIGYGYIQGDKYLDSNRTWMAAVQLGYGGYETGNLAVVISKQTKSSSFRLVLDHLQGLIVPTVFGGAGIYAEYAYSFKR